MVGIFRVRWMIRKGAEPALSSVNNPVSDRAAPTRSAPVGWLSLGEYRRRGECPPKTHKLHGSRLAASRSSPAIKLQISKGSSGARGALITAPAWGSSSQARFLSASLERSRGAMFWRAKLLTRGAKKSRAPETHRRLGSARAGRPARSFLQLRAQMNIHSPGLAPVFE
jgi:hypothetical protein